MRAEETFNELELILGYFRSAPRRGVMLDVGAQYGQSFAPFLDLDWRVLAFEPDPKNRALLLEKGLDRRVTLIPDAVSYCEMDDVPFFSSVESSGISSLSAFRSSHQESARVKVRTLRNVMAEQGIQSIDFLKIDTEGHDLFVLRGYPWDRERPEVVLCEFEDNKTRSLGYDYHDLGKFLLAQGYAVLLSEWQPIVRYGGNHRWVSLRHYPADVTDPKAWGNFIALGSQAARTYFDRLASR